jgi:hypothetical protein
VISFDTWSSMVSISSERVPIIAFTRMEQRLFLSSDTNKSIGLPLTNFANRPASNQTSEEESQKNLSNSSSAIAFHGQYLCPYILSLSGHCFQLTALFYSTVPRSYRFSFPLIAHRSLLIAFLFRSLLHPLAP